MTEQTKNDTAVTALAIPGSVEAPAIFGDRTAVIGMANRLAKTFPAAKEHNFDADDLLWAANICVVMNLNPWRGEVYFWRDNKGYLVYSEGYKILVRWANDRCPYDERVEALPLNEGELHKFRCFILRLDKREGLAFYKEMGASWREAFETVADWADGVVMENETVSRKGYPIDPPKGWTWEQRARIRALKAALRLSHGAPTLQELAKASYDVNGVQTKPEDWEGTEELKYPEERARLAEVRAQGREHAAAWDQLTIAEREEKFTANVDMMRAPEDFEGYGDEPKSEIGKMAKAQMDHMLGDEPAKKPPPGTEDQPAKQNQARIKSKGWNEAARELVHEIGYYGNLDADPNWAHLCGAAYKMGYPEVTDDNLKEVIEALAMYAEDQQAQAGVNDAPPPPDVGPENGDEVQKALL